MSSSSLGLLDYLADVPDPRIERCRAHRLIDILMIAVCGSFFSPNLAGLIPSLA